MSIREIQVHGHKIQVSETGSGTPLLYLHGFTDIHGAVDQWQPFHKALAADRTLIAPAHPGCAGSQENLDLMTVEDVEFFYLEMLDALGIETVDVVGVCIGGWIAAELAVRHPERFNRLALVGACGLFVSGQPIADLFFQGQPTNGTSYAGLRRLLFADANSPIARDFIPDAKGKGEVEPELTRYKTFRFTARFGFRPPYLHDRKLVERLGRFPGPALALWGGEDHLVPITHGEAYRDGFGDGRLEVIPEAGHCVHLEKPDEAAAIIGKFFSE
ncbi:MAG: alpha/beta fold hydrolase [Rhodospirillales bacterium]|nr:alpha/beta fold hydrolase [Rhodospirillales bacterium]